jgi:hypothetical protein
MASEPTTEPTGLTSRISVAMDHTTGRQTTPWAHRQDAQIDELWSPIGIDHVPFEQFDGHRTPKLSMNGPEDDSHGSLIKLDGRFELFFQIGWKRLHGASKISGNGERVHQGSDHLRPIFHSLGGFSWGSGVQEIGKPGWVGFEIVLSPGR